MTQHIYKTIITLLLVVIVILSFMIRGFEKDVDCSDKDSFDKQRYQISEGFQTSAKYISKLAKLDACSDPEDRLKQQIHALIKDIEIKATSYALINKVFFWASLALALGIMVIPIVNSVTDKESTAHKIFSPAQLPAIVVLAGLFFTLYTDYKGKQTGVENLMRYSYFSGDDIKIISKNVREGLAEIDSGQDFSNLIK